MNQTKCVLKLSVAALFLILGLCANIRGVYAQRNSNTITFDNQSGEPAFVKVIGPTRQAIDVPNAQSRTVNVAVGEYYILVRYGNKPEAYRYAKGDPFTVTRPAKDYSAITITLHKVVGGDYPSHPISGEEFDKTPVATGKATTDEKKATLSNEAIDYVRIDEDGRIIDRRKLKVNAQFVGSIVEGKLTGKLIVPEGENVGLVMQKDPLPQGPFATVSKYRRGYRYIRLEDVGKKNAKYYRAIWLEAGDYIDLGPDALSSPANDAPGTIYTKGSIINGKPSSQDMMLTKEGELKPVTNIPRKSKLDN